ncbi:hypothetical protein [Rhodohalobacter halophilus]|uniref:hypothetical protein n=1 Tax=Rhodohalobacter halophilus TaxID=1812810 RepID=UPI00083FB7C1|nr:hypothetical protein [Rhodohalobacter halophilus]
MLKLLLLASLIGLTSFLTATETDTSFVSVQQAVTKFQSIYSYCKPDDDPEFSLTYEDERFYYYTGSKVISGLIYQYSPNAPITFDSRTNQACQFELTQGFQVDFKQLNDDFSIENAWRNAPKCDPADGKPYLSGIYALTITGFKISKSYVDNYDPQKIRSRMEMSQFEFYADYDDVVEVIAPAEVRCPIVLR